MIALSVCQDLQISILIHLPDNCDMKLNRVSCSQIQFKGTLLMSASARILSSISTSPDVPTPNTMRPARRSSTRTTNKRSAESLEIKAALAKWSTSDLYGLIAENREFGLGVLRLMREQEVGMVAMDPRRLSVCEYHVHGKEMRCPGQRD
jgi:hypothetical protein